MSPVAIAVASGKGGTGKTSVAANLALSIEGADYIDCDVETPNGHLFLHPEIRERIPISQPMPRIDPARCTRCGDCAEACEFNALAVTRQGVLVFPELCHGCGVCIYVCRETGAIGEMQREIGSVSAGLVGHGDSGLTGFVQGCLNPGETATVAAIKAAKRHANPERIRLFDAPAGTACPMVETLHGADYCLLVTEPTPFGLHDLELALAVARRLDIPCGLVLNRSDIGDRAVPAYCQAQGIAVLMEIPYDRSLAEAYARGMPWVALDSAWRGRFRALLQAVEEDLTP